MIKLLKILKVSIFLETSVSIKTHWLPLSIYIFLMCFSCHSCSSCVSYCHPWTYPTVCKLNNNIWFLHLRIFLMHCAHSQFFKVWWLSIDIEFFLKTVADLIFTLRVQLLHCRTFLKKGSSFFQRYYIFLFLMLVLTLDSDGTLKLFISVFSPYYYDVSNLPHNTFSLLLHFSSNLFWRYFKFSGKPYSFCTVSLPSNIRGLFDM